MYKWVISLMLFVGCADSTQPHVAIRDIDVQEAANLLKQDATVVVLDIRTPQEFQQGHIAGAENIDFRGPEFREKIEVLGRINLILCTALQVGAARDRYRSLKNCSLSRCITWRRVSMGGSRLVNQLNNRCSPYPLIKPHSFILRQRVERCMPNRSAASERFH